MGQRTPGPAQQPGHLLQSERPMCDILLLLAEAEVARQLPHLSQTSVAPSTQRLFLSKSPFSTRTVSCLEISEAFGLGKHQREISHANAFCR